MATEPTPWFRDQTGSGWDFLLSEARSAEEAMAAARPDPFSMGDPSRPAAQPRDPQQTQRGDILEGLRSSRQAREARWGEIDWMGRPGQTSGFDARRWGSVLEAGEGAYAGSGQGGWGSNPELAAGIVETAAALGMDPVELATFISYETAGTFDPLQPGPTTKWGQHRGLIQFGEPQARDYGVDWNDPLRSQLGADGAIVRYARAHGFEPGMSGLQLYATINAGSPYRLTASDAAAGGAPGTVYEKYTQQMGGHRAKAESLLSVLGV